MAKVPQRLSRPRPETRVPASRRQPESTTAESPMETSASASALDEGADVAGHAAEFAGRGALALVRVHQVRRAQADDAVDGAVLGEDGDSLGCGEGNGETAEGLEIDEAGGVDVFDDVADLIAVALEHDGALCAHVEDGVEVAVDVDCGLDAGLGFDARAQQERPRRLGT